MKKKYEFTGVEKNGLKQIRRISDGILGGWIESEKNLSHEGDCFVSENAKVFGNAKVSGNAKVFDKAEVFDKAKVYGNAKVFGNAWVSGNACVFGNAKVSGNVWVSCNACVYSNTEVSGDAWVYDNVKRKDELPSELANLPEGITEVKLNGQTYVKTTVTVVEWKKV